MQIKLWKEVLNEGYFICGNNRKYLFERNVKAGDTEVEFICHELSLILQIVSTSCYLSINEQEKEQALREMGYNPVRITKYEILHNTSGLKLFLRRYIDQNKNKAPGDTLTAYPRSGGFA